MKRVVVFAVLCGLGVGSYAFLESSQRLYGPVPEAPAQAAFEREVSAARELGLSEAAQASVDLSAFDRKLAAYKRDRTLSEGWRQEDGCVLRALNLEAGECVAVVTSLSGGWSAGRLSLQPEGATCSSKSEDIATHDPIAGLAGHVQFCSAQARPLQIALAARERDPVSEAPGKLHYAVLRGSSNAVGGLDALTRGWIKPDRMPTEEMP